MKSYAKGSRFPYAGFALPISSCAANSEQVSRATFLSRYVTTFSSTIMYMELKDNYYESSSNSQ